MKYLLVLLLLVLAGCEQQQTMVPAEGDAAKPVHGDTFIEASIGEPNNLLPVLSSDSASSDINRLVYNGLIRYDKDLRLEGELAESWEISEDNLTFTFHLRKGVTWHDGSPFTSADVLFTYEMYINPDVPTSYAEDFLQVASAETPDPYTFRVTYEKPYAPALESWGPRFIRNTFSQDRTSPRVHYPEVRSVPGRTGLSNGLPAKKWSCSPTRIILKDSPTSIGLFTGSFLTRQPSSSNFRQVGWTS